MARIRHIAAAALLATMSVAPAFGQDAVVIRTQSARVAAVRTKTPGEFYVALESIADAAAWRPRTVQDCVSRDFISGIRRWFGKNDAVTASVIIKTKNLPAGDVTLPLFVVSNNERSDNGKPACTSSVFNGLITPFIRADAMATFSFEVTPLVAKDSTITTATRLVNLASQLTAAGAGASSVLSRLGANPIQSLTKSIDDELSVSWGGSGQSADSTATDLVVFPADEDWTNQTDTITFNLPKLVASRGGINVTSNLLPASMIRVQFRDSLIAVGGRYPESSAGILGSSLTKTKSDTLQKMIKDGLPNATEINLVQANNADQMASICRALKDVLGPTLTTKDALVAIYAVLDRFSSYGAKGDIRTDACLNAADQNRLKAINPAFMFAADVRETPAQRDQRIADIYVPIAKALAAGTPQAIQGVSADNGQGLRLAVSDADQLPARSDGKPWAAAGADAVSHLQDLRQTGGFLRVGCFQARIANSLTAVVGVLALGNRTLGAALETDAQGKLRGLRIGAIDTIRDLFLGTDGGNWPAASCDLAI